MKYRTDCRDCFIVPLYWPIVLVSSVMLGLVVTLYIWFDSDGRYIFMGSILSALIVHFSTGYTLNHDGIQVKLFGLIPLRKVPWRHIGKVYVFRKWKDWTIGKHYGRVYNEGFVVITMQWCIPFEFGINNPSSFCSRHPVNSIGFRIPPKRTEEYIDGIRRFFPNLEIVADNMI